MNAIKRRIWIGVATFGLLALAGAFAPAAAQVPNNSGLYGFYARNPSGLYTTRGQINAYNYGLARYYYDTGKYGFGGRPGLTWFGLPTMFADWYAVPYHYYASNPLMWGNPYGGYYPYPYYAYPQTTYNVTYDVGSQLKGAAAVYSAQGDFLIKQQEAARMAEETRALRLDNLEKAFDRAVNGYVRPSGSAAPAGVTVTPRAGY
jgi:hypothetical protein